MSRLLRDKRRYRFQTIGDVLSSISSSAPSPGGGTTSMLTGSFGIALILKGLEVGTILQSVEPEVLELRRAIESALEHLVELADHDDRVFARYMELRQVSQEMQAANGYHSQAFALSQLEIAECPLEAAELMGGVLSRAEAVARICSASLRSDVAAGKAILNAAIHAILWTVDANLQTTPKGGSYRKLIDRRNSIKLTTSGIDAH